MRSGAENTSCFYLIRFDSLRRVFVSSLPPTTPTENLPEDEYSVSSEKQSLYFERDHPRPHLSHDSGLEKIEVSRFSTNGVFQHITGCPVFPIHHSQAIFNPSLAGTSDHFQTHIPAQHFLLNPFLVPATGLTSFYAQTLLASTRCREGYNPDTELNHPLVATELIFGALGIFKAWTFFTLRVIPLLHE